MTLRDLLARLPGSRVDLTDARLDADVRGLVLDSRKVGPGDVFFALPGVKADGARFAEAAAAAGALAVVGARGLRVAGAAVIEVDEPRLALAKAACLFHGSPSRSGMWIVAVTGTNGKTTTTYMLESIWNAQGDSCAVIGTTGIRIAGETRPSAFTTPEAPELQAVLAEILAARIECVAIEFSSHAQAQRRTWGVQVEAAIFTNLTQDHLDYHGTMEAYLDAKLMLFDGRNANASPYEGIVAIVNGDDPAAPAVVKAAETGRADQVMTFGEGASNDLRIEVLEMLPHGMRLRFTSVDDGTVEFTLPMLGRFNAYNAAAAYLATAGMGSPKDAALRGLENFRGVPGRLERVDAGQPFAVVVDYAHTPDALERTLAACREHARGRVLCVFGCGGDRDRGKRPLMGGIAARLADLAWVTNDNPRSEDPAAIAREIVAGAPAGRLVTILDRREAIAAALAAAREGDVVLVAGKGHETTQTIGADVLPFDDREVARTVLGGAR